MPGLLATLLALFSNIGTPVPACDEAGRDIPGWGEVIDPDADCRIKVVGSRLLVDIPAKKHDLSIETGTMNAPRVLREQAGDFMVDVKVSGDIRPEGNRTSEKYLGYHGAGLLLWVTRETYIRLERAAVLRQDGEIVHYANFEFRQDGKHAGSHALEIPDQEVFLRLQRRGGQIFGYLSTDGVHWESLESFVAKFPDEIKLGVASVNTSTTPLKVIFSDLEILEKKTSNAPPQR